MKRDRHIVGETYSCRPPWNVAHSVKLRPMKPAGASWIRVTLLCLPALMFCLTAAVSEAEEKPSLRLAEIYYQTLDLVFPVPAAECKPNTYRFVLRFEPSNRPESQIVITGCLRDGYDVTTYTLPPDSKSLDQQIRAASRNTPDPAAIAKTIQVQVNHFKLAAKSLDNLMAEFSNICFQPTISTTNITRLMGGVQYQLWLDASDGSEVHYSFKDGFSGPTLKPLTQWMNEVKKTLIEQAPVDPKRTEKRQDPGR